MQSNMSNAAVAGAESPQDIPPMFTKRLGSTVFQVSVHFSKTSAETVEDKILRMMKNEVRNNA